MGVGFASLQWSPVIVVLAVLISWACAAGCLVLWDAPRAGAPAGGTRCRERRKGQQALIVALCVVAASSFTAASPVLALLAVLLVVLTSPIVVRRRPHAASRWATASSSGRTTDAVSPPRAELPGWARTISGSLEKLDDHELFTLWRRTFWELQGQPTDEMSLCIVALRQSCLEELEKRNPAALRAWLESGARASGGPERFWTEGADPGDAGPRQ